MKICLLGPTAPFRGGIAHTTALLCRALRDRHHVELFSFSRQYPKWLFPGKSDRDDSQAPLTVPGTRYTIDSMNPLTWLRTARSIVREKPDLVIIPWWVAFWAPVFGTICRHLRKHSNAELVFLCHNVVEHESSRLKQMLTRAVLLYGDRFVILSGQDRRNLLRMLPDAKAQVCFLPTFAGLHEERVEKNAAKAGLGLQGPVLLFFGFVRPYKGLDVLLDAMPRIRERTAATLLVVGEFWKDREKYFEQIDRLGLKGCVRIHDSYVPNEEVPLYFGAADAVVLPYRSATASAICQLAFGFGRPVVATRVGCLAEVVQDGISGRLVDPEDPKAFADAVGDILDPENLGRYTAGVRETARRFSWENLADSLTGSITSETPCEL
ncbi:glycosyltransferase [bacterium]|nr:glycosyltransferase [bacterium]